MAELRRSEVSALRWADCPPRGQTHGLPPVEVGGEGRVLEPAAVRARRRAGGAPRSTAGGCSGESAAAARRRARAAHRRAVRDGGAGRRAGGVGVVRSKASSSGPRLPPLHHRGPESPWQTRRPPLDRRNSPARPRPIHAVSAAPSAIDELCSAGGRSGPRPAPVLAAITLVGRCRRRAAVDAVPASGAVGRVHEGTWRPSSVSQPSGVDCAGLRLVAERSLG